MLLNSRVVLFPVNPKTAACFREAFYRPVLRGDPGDTEVLLDILFTPSRPVTTAEARQSETRPVAAVWGTAAARW